MVGSSTSVLSEELEDRTRRLSRKAEKKRLHDLNAEYIAQQEMSAVNFLNFIFISKT